MLAFSPPTLAQSRDGSDEAVTFADVLAAPDDVAVSLRWAEQEIAAGRLEQASATLERILIIAPGADEVRLLYGVVLYRLGAFIDAEAQLQRLIGRELKPEHVDTRDRYLQLVAEERRAWAFDFTIGAGVHYDTNRNFSPKSDTAFLNGAPVNLNIGEEDDFGFIGFVGGGATFNPQDEFVDKAFVRAIGITDEQVEVDELDLLGLSVLVGAEGGYDAYRLSGAVGADFFNFDGDGVVDVFKASARVERPLRDPNGLTPYAELSIAYEDFADALDERDGGRFGFGLGVEAIVDPRVKLDGRLGLDLKDADAKFESYVAPTIDLRAIYAFAAGQAFIGDASYRYEAYQDENPAVRPDERRDNEFLIGLTYFLAIDRAFADELSNDDAALLRDLNLTAGVSYQNVDSNIPNFEFDNFRVQALLTKKFKF